MKKSLCIILFTIAICMVLFSSYTDAMSNNRVPDADINNNMDGDYHNISIYKMKMEDDSATFSSRPAIYYPMDGTVVIGGSHYEVESNPEYNESKKHSSHFRYIVGEYYTNLD